MKSLRETMVLDSSESFGVPFGQKECLTRRLSNILEQYPQGITPFLEFIQNADDSGARNVKIVRGIRNSQHKFIQNTHTHSNTGTQPCKLWRKVTHLEGNEVLARPIDSDLQ